MFPFLNDHSLCENKLSDIHLHLFSLLTAPPKAELDARLQGDLVTIRAGSDLVLDAAVGGKPEPKIIWTKGDKELDMCEKVSLQYTGKRATAVIKFCDRSDSGKYTLTVKNASGTKAVSVVVKVLGKHVRRPRISIAFSSMGRKNGLHHALSLHLFQIPLAHVESSLSAESQKRSAL